MPSFRRRESVIDADRVDEPPQEPERPTDAADVLALAEEAEAEAAEADAIAAAARARARAIRLRRQADAAKTVVDVQPVLDAVDTDEVTGATEVDTKATEAPAFEEGDRAQVPEERAARPRRRWGRIVKLLVASLAVICTCALVTLSVLMVLQNRNAVQERQRSAEYAAAARQGVVTLMSLDFNKAKEDVQRIIDNSTGQFRADFENTAEDFVKVAQDAKVITEVNVTATGVETMTDDTAVVLVAATSRVTNNSGAKEEPRSWRLAVTLQRDGGQIKMSKVEFVP